MRLPLYPGARQKDWDFLGTIDLSASSTFQSSHHQGSCQPTLTHSATHHLEKLSLRPPNVFSAEWVWFQTVNRCLVASVRKSGDSVCGWNAGQTQHRELQPHDTSRSSVYNMMGNFWISLRKETQLQDWGCGSAVCMVFSLVHVGAFILCSDRRQ